MKRWFWLLLIFIVVALAAVYIAIPSTVVATAAIKVQVADKSIIRIINNKSMQLWFAADSATTENNNSFNYQGYQFALEKKNINAITINVQKDDDAWQSELLIIPTNVDATLIKWNATLAESINPFKKISAYIKAKKLEKTLEELTRNFAAYTSETANSYNIHIVQIHLKDSVLLAKKFETKGYPQADAVYNQITNLKTYIAANNARAEDYPMLHVTTTDSINYQCMVGVAINKTINENDEFKIKRMPYGGYMLTTKIVGGNNAIKQGFKNLESYIYDYNRRVPAIPFQLLVTDRSAVSDTSQWTTILYYPVE